MSSSETANSDLMVTPEVSVSLASLGSLFYRWLIEFCARAPVYGIYCVLVVIALYSIWKRPQKNSRTFWLVSALVIQFFVVTFDWASPLAHFIRHLKVNMMEPTTLSLKERRMSVSNWYLFESNLLVMEVWINGGSDMGPLFLINDILVCWRAMAIWSAARRSRAILASIFSLLLLTSFAAWLTCGSLLLRNTLAQKATINMNNKIEFSRNDMHYVALIYTSTAASIASNFLATGMIGYTAYTHLHASSTRGMKPLRAGRVLLYLTESGLFYAVIQILRLILPLTAIRSGPIGTGGPLVMSFRIVSAVTIPLTAMYSPALIIIVKYGLSIADNVQFSSGAGTSPAQPDNVQSGISTMQFESHGHSTTRDTHAETLDAKSGISATVIHTTSSRDSAMERAEKE